MSDDARFGASEAACYAFPGEDQGPLRSAFMDGSAWAATEIERLRERLKGSDMLAHVRGEQIERLRQPKVIDIADILEAVAARLKALEGK